LLSQMQLQQQAMRGGVASNFIDTVSDSSTTLRGGDSPQSAPNEQPDDEMRTPDAFDEIDGAEGLLTPNPSQEIESEGHFL
jgi:hypothetical protein